ncbi:diguanylate cyclase domain-containing protein [Sulfurimonas sp.]
MNSLKSISVNILMPLLISLVFVIIIIYQANIPKIIFSLVPYIFYAISALIFWVSWHFNRNRFIFIIIPLVLMQVGFKYLGVDKATLLYIFTSIVFPLHLLIFLVLKERGLFSIWGIMKILFFVFEIAIVLYFIYFPHAIIKEFIDIKIFASSMYPLKDISVVIGIAVVFVLTMLVMFNRYLVYNSSFLIIAISFYSGLYFLKTPHANEISLLAISVVIFALLIRESYRLAFYDELTELPGRRALVEDMAKLGMKYSFAMIDIDFFKKFNDTYGHDTGDDVLKMVATKLSEVTGGGKAYRYGGEEFVILFPSVERDQAFVHTDLVRDIVSKSAFVVRNKKGSKKIFVNISAGLVQNSSKDKDPFATMKRADNALYKAKKAGRNQVVKG